MAIHAVTVKAARFYKVYVDDPECNMPNSEVIERAKQLFLEDPDSNAILDPELGVEEQDIIGADYDYSI